jgi:hypothetical protein
VDASTDSIRPVLAHTPDRNISVANRAPMAPAIIATMDVLTAFTPVLPGAVAMTCELYCASTRSIFCFASATAPSFRGAKVRSVDRAISGKSARVA